MESAGNSKSLDCKAAAHKTNPTVLSGAPPQPRASPAATLGVDCSQTLSLGVLSAKRATTPGPPPPPPERIRNCLLFSPRHIFFSLDAGALRENCRCPIPAVAYSEIRSLCAILALVSGKRPALVQCSYRSTCAPVPSHSFIANLGNGAFSLGVATRASDS